MMEYILKIIIIFFLIIIIIIFNILITLKSILMCNKWQSLIY